MSGAVANNSNDSYTSSGHLVGMLDRDQRTVFDAKPKSCAPLDACHACSCVARTIGENPQGVQTPRSQRKGPRPRCSAKRVKKVLAVVSTLLIVIPSVLSAPSGSMEHQEEPFWVLNENVLPEDNITQGLREQLAKTIQTQAKIACNKANHSLEEYTKHQFSMTPEQVHQRYNSTTFDWLPSKDDIPKQFGQDVTDGFTRSMEEEMIHLYHQFQKIGVGIEQIVREYNNCTPNGVDQTFCNNFNMMRQDLTQLLRELNMNIGTLGLARKPDVARTTMPAEDRDVDETARRIRNWVIYREYINALEYTIKAFESHL